MANDSAEAEAPGPAKATFFLTEVFKSAASGVQCQAQDEVIPDPRHPWFELKVLF